MSMQTQNSVLYRNLGIIGAVLLLLLLGRFEFSLQFIINLALILAFVAIAYVGWRTQRISNVLLLPLGALALFLVFRQPDSAWMRLVGGLFAFVPFAVIMGLRPTHPGKDDIKLVTLLGLLFGFPNILWILLIALSSGGLVALMLWFMQRENRPAQIPYAPFLCFGALTVLLVLPFYGF